MSAEEQFDSYHALPVRFRIAEDQITQQEQPE